MANPEYPSRLEAMDRERKTRGNALGSLLKEKGRAIVKASSRHS